MNLTFKDKFNKLKDEFGEPGESNKRPKGRVKIFDKETGEKLEDTNNLVVYQGRKWVMQKVFNQILTGGNSLHLNSFISWIGLGTDGATSNLFIPLAPSLTDASLGNQATINNKPATDCVLNGTLHPLDSVTFEEDGSNDNEFLIASIIATIGEDDANGPAGGTSSSDYYDINEAGLYISNSTDPGSIDPASVDLFARVTFSTIRKFSERQLVFNWLVYF